MQVPGRDRDRTDLYPGMLMVQQCLPVLPNPDAVPIGLELHDFVYRTPDACPVTHWTG